MLQHVAAANEISLVVSVTVGVKILNEGYSPWFLIGPIGHITGIKPNPIVVAKITKQLQELALAAADLDDLLSLQCITIHQSRGQRPGIALKSRREVEGILITLAVLHKARLKGQIEDVPTFTTIPQPNISSGSILGRLACWPKQIAVNRHLGDIQQYTHAARSADRAGDSRAALVFHNLSSGPMPAAHFKTCSVFIR